MSRFIGAARKNFTQKAKASAKGYSPKQQEGIPLYRKEFGI